MITEALSHTSQLYLTSDPLWFFIEEGFEPLREREVESVLSIGNGYLGTRGSVEETTSFSQPGTFIAGFYDTLADADESCVLAAAPEWISMKVEVDGTQLSLERGEQLLHRRILDVGQGLLVREWRHRDEENRITRVRTWRFASMSNPHLMVQRVEILPENHEGTTRVVFNFNGLNRPERQNKVLTTLEQRELDGNGVLLVTRTRETAITLAMASKSRCVSPEYEGNGRPPVCRTEYNDDGIREIWEWSAQPGKAMVFERVIALYTSRDADSFTPYFPEEDEHKASQPHNAEIYRKKKLVAKDIVQSAELLLRESATEGFDILLDRHRQAWQKRWSFSDVQVDGDMESQRALRFAIYHLTIAAAPWNHRVSIGARTLTGSVYEGHIFWDTEIFILPFFVYTWPEAAMALLMYRYHTLPMARLKAREKGYQGALYPWESAITGEEETPPVIRMPDGEIIPIFSGLMEDHIVCDVAYGVWMYWQATADDEFFKRYGAEMLLECARFWASRVTYSDDDELFHINAVVGPDEYHENVNDNAFTNRMARWNMEVAKITVAWLKEHSPEQWALLREAFHFSEAEVNLWQGIAQRMYSGYDEETMLFEQHKGFHNLTYVDLSQYAKDRVPMDVTLGRHVIQSTQVVKQADVLMLFFLLGSEFNEEQLRRNFEYYEPRTGHGSSLSPPVHALLAARLGNMELAMRYFRETGAIDLGNNLGNSAGGVHAAAMGGYWQAAVNGFGGVQLVQGALCLDPHLPPDWKGMKFHLNWRGQRVEVGMQRNAPATLHQPGEPKRPQSLTLTIEIDGETPVPFRIGPEGPLRSLAPGRKWDWIGDAEGHWRCGEE